MMAANICDRDTFEFLTVFQVQRSLTLANAIILNPQFSKPPLHALWGTDGHKKPQLQFTHKKNTSTVTLLLIFIFYKYIQHLNILLKAVKQIAAQENSEVWVHVSTDSDTKMEELKWRRWWWDREESWPYLGWMSVRMTLLGSIRTSYSGGLLTHLLLTSPTLHPPPHLYLSPSHTPPISHPCLPWWCCRTWEVSFNMKYFFWSLPCHIFESPGKNVQKLLSKL